MLLKEPDKVYYNRPQLRMMAVMANRMMLVWPRGIGKSTGPIAYFTSHHAFAMPRSLGAFNARTYQQLMTRTLPPVIKGWEQLGYRMGVDYFVREKAPAKKRWDLPITPPLKWDMAIHWRNGSAQTMISQERSGAAQGISIDYDVCDERKVLKNEQYNEEVVPAKRGNRDRFGKLSCHHSNLSCTDMPTSPAARYILEMEREMNVDQINLILAIQMDVYRVQCRIQQGGLAKGSIRKYLSDINRWEAQLNELRKTALYYHEANPLDNVELLGKEYLLRMKDTMPDYLFRTSLLNIRPDRVEGGFYPDLDDERHCYDAPTAYFIEQAGLDLEKLEIDDCRKDGMLQPNLPLDIAPDFGSSFNCLVVGQLFGENFNIDNQVYVKHPDKIRHLAVKFDNYYRYHIARVCYLYHDHTMIGEDAVREYGFIYELERELKSLGWEVRLVYIGQAWNHHTRYTYWGRRFAHADPELPRVQFNRDNTEPTRLSLHMAGARQTRKGFEKDKRPEQDDNVDQAEATHLSDACDLLVVGKFLSLGSLSSAGADTLYG